MNSRIRENSRTRPTVARTFTNW